MNPSTYFLASGFDWEPGQVVDNSTFRASPHETFFLANPSKSLLLVPDYMARRATEAVFEEIRATLYPEKPSRRLALYLSRTIEDAEFWVSKAARSSYRIYEVSDLERLSVADANYVWYNYCVRLHLDPIGQSRRIFSDDVASEVEHVASAYWRNEPTESHQVRSRIETLFVGALQVEQAL